MGAVNDGIYSIVRYVNNNFSDGYFEDCLNLTFNLVKIDEETDSLVLREKRSTLVRLCLASLIAGSVRHDHSSSYVGFVLRSLSRCSREHER